MEASAQEEINEVRDPSGELPEVRTGSRSAVTRPEAGKGKHVLDHTRRSHDSVNDLQ